MCPKKVGLGWLYCPLSVLPQVGTLLPVSHSVSLLFCKAGLLLLQLILCYWTHVIACNIMSLYACSLPSGCIRFTCFPHCTVPALRLAAEHSQRGMTLIGFGPEQPYCHLMRPVFKNERQRKRVRETYPSLCSVWTAAFVVFSFSVVLGVVPFRQSTSAPMFNGSSAETERRERQNEIHTIGKKQHVLIQNDG